MSQADQKKAEKELRQKQIQQAEELLFSGPQKSGFAKDLFFGRFHAEAIMPYPQQSETDKKTGDDAVAEVREYAEKHIDAFKIDKESEIPQSVAEGLGKVGVLGMTISKIHGGRGYSQFNYCRVMEVIGAHCGSTAVFVNAHHSIGIRALEIYGTPEQQQKWIAPLLTGEKLAAFALTETEAGSDAGNVQTKAEPTPDGEAYILNGGKRYITNGAFAQVLTVMARTPDPSDPDGKVTAFLVTPDMEGFKVLEERMDKCGIRGTATGRMEFTNMRVPKENILGNIGEGLQLALSVLNFGRTTFGASCTGAAKFCVEQSVARANDRRQFGKTIGEFELIKEKIAIAAADTYAMESATLHTAALIDSGAHDYMLETSMLKVFASDRLWSIVNETLQIWGGAGFFTDQPFERMMRDARLNLIGEGANEVLRCFNCMVGIRGVVKELEGILKKPWKITSLLRKGPEIPVHHSVLQPSASGMSKQILAFSKVCRNNLIAHREDIMDRELIQARIGDIATELFVSGCVYSRLTTLLSSPTSDEKSREKELKTGLYYLKIAHRRIQGWLSDLKNNDDRDQMELADTYLKS
jgi:acyl-CoA dehydrogenase family member 9